MKIGEYLGQREFLAHAYNSEWTLGFVTVHGPGGSKADAVRNSDGVVFYARRGRQGSRVIRRAGASVAATFREARRP